VRSREHDLCLDELRGVVQQRREARVLRQVPAEPLAGEPTRCEQRLDVRRRTFGGRTEHHRREQHSLQLVVE
jgi:hypothetical protein